MSSQQLVQRLLCSHAKVDLQRVRNGFLSERDFPKLTVAAGRLRDAPLFIDDTAGISIGEMRAKARRLKSQHDIQLIVIDYLQLLRSTGFSAQFADRVRKRAERPGQPPEASAACVPTSRSATSARGDSYYSRSNLSALRKLRSTVFFVLFAVLK